MKKKIGEFLMGLVEAADDVLAYVRAAKYGSPDILCRRIGDDVIYWPVTERGREDLRHAFADWCPHRRFGYAVPADKDDVVYNTLDETYSSSIARLGKVGSADVIIL